MEKVKNKSEIKNKLSLPTASRRIESKLSPHMAARAAGLVIRNKAYAYIQNHPGATAMQIGTDLRVDDRLTLSRMLAWLKAGGYIRAKGATRNTTYNATKKVYKS